METSRSVRGVRRLLVRFGCGMAVCALAWAGCAHDGGSENGDASETDGSEVRDGGAPTVDSGEDGLDDGGGTPVDGSHEGDASQPGSDADSHGRDAPSDGGREDGSDAGEERNDGVGDGGDAPDAGRPDGWTRMVGASGEERVKGVATSGSGHVYAAGWTDSGLDGGNYRGGKWDGFLVKFDDAGARKWVRHVGTSVWDKVLDAAIDSSGHVYVVGWTGEDLHGRSHNGGFSDGFVVKYDPAGQREWSRMIGTSARDGARSVMVRAGNLYVSGTTGGELGGRSYGGTTDAFVVSFDTGGKREWTRLFGASGEQTGAALAAGGAGSLYLAGKTTAAFDDRTYGGGESDGFVLGFDASGARRWTRLVGTAGKDLARDVAGGEHGGVYVAGDAAEALEGGTFHGSWSDAFVAKFDGAGSRQWNRMVGTSEIDLGSAVAVRSSGEVSVAGTVSTGLDGDSYNGGPHDGFVVEFSSDGDRRRAELLGTSGLDRASSLAAGLDGDLVVGGWSDRAIAAGNYGGGSFDGFLHRLGPR